ncbi:MAG TPA: multidrug effflux MFS transporter [Kofleriaceae bacterium]|nr:multidrug effflux MFS transporter [Kofleriaceae bacterium]
MSRAVADPDPMALTSSPARSELTLVLVLGALTAFAPLAIDTYLPAFAAIARDLHTRPDQVDWTLAIYFLGLAAGQLAIGPVADRVGRRGPLQAGLAVFFVASVAAALAPNLGLLIAARGVQALGGAACSVTARAVVRDRYHGAEAARVNSRVVLVMGAAPIVAPLLGAALLRAAGWRSIFGLLAAIAAVAYAVVRRVLPETATARPASSLGAAMRALAGDREFLGFALIAAMASSALFAYISGAPVMFLAVHGVSPAQFSWLFGANAAGYIAMSQLNARLLRAHAPRTLLTAGVTGLAGAGAVLTAGALAGLGTAATELGCLMLMSSLGFVLPNAVALALDSQGRQAGNAAAWLGALQFGLSAVASSAVAALTDDSALPAGATVLAVALVACALRLAIAVRARRLARLAA